MKHTSDLLAKSDLKKRGWTDSLIKRFLPEPDEIRPNPKYRSAAPMILYLAARVAAIEADCDFQAAMTETKCRQDHVARAVKTKRARLSNYIEMIEI